MKNNTKKITLSAMFMALGLILPFLTGQIQQFGNMMLPMHFPVFLCALICGWQYGLAVGFILPFLRYALFGMPMIYPMGIAMAFELATYAFVAGYLYGHSRWKCIVSLYRSMIIAMISGRLVWGLVEVILLGMGGKAFTWQMFLAGAFLNAIPGIILQLVLIPAIMVALNRAGLVHFQKEHKKEIQKESKCKNAKY